MSVRGGWDDRSSYRGSPPRYTVKQYRIPRRDEEERVSVYESDRYSGRASEPRFEETRIVRRERERTPEPRVEREIRVERYEREPEPPRRVEREYRVERDIERVPARREPYELDRYTKTTEYFPPATRAPIVVPQPREEEDFQVIRRSEVIDDRQLVRRPSPPQEEDYYYERRTREVDGDRRDDDYREEQRVRRGRNISPGDSVSQRHRDYSSDESIVYVKKEVREERGGSPHHKRHIAEGAIAGIGAAELIRHHRKKEGDEEGSRAGRIGKDLGAAAVGAVGAEVISRVRAKSRRRSSSYDDYSPEREGRHRHRHREHRSRSRSRVKQLATVGLGAAAIAAAVGYARHKNNQQNKQNKLAPDDRRSRSRTRRHSTSEVGADDPRNPSHRNTRMAQAGLAGAAITGLIERARSKSKGRDGKSRSRSRLRTGIPIAAAGLGSAAIAGLYEKRQANKREEEERKSRKEERKRSRSRSNGPYDGPRAASASDPGLIEYGEAPVYSNSGIPDYGYRPASQAGFYPPPQDAIVPAPPVPYGTRVVETIERERRPSSPTRDRERRRDYSSESDDHERRRRHRRKKGGDGSHSRSQSRTRELATAGLAAGAAAIGATQYAKHKERKRAEKERDRDHLEADNANYDGGPYSPGPYSPLSPPAGALPAPGYPPDSYYPQTNAFPPPPNAAGFSPQPAYNPGEYSAPNAQIHPDYGYTQPGYVPPQGVYSPPAPEQYAPPGGAPRGGHENVSAEPYLNTAYASPAPDLRDVEEGVNTPRPSRRNRGRASSHPNNKSVQFDIDDSDINSPDAARHRRQRSARDANYDSYESESSVDHDRARRHKRSHGRGHRSRDASPAESDETIDLPERFDEEGRKKPERGEDPIADKIEEFLSGKGSTGKLFKSLTDGILGGGAKDDRDSGRQRRR